MSFSTSGYLCLAPTKTWLILYSTTCYPSLLANRNTLTVHLKMVRKQLCPLWPLFCQDLSEFLFDQSFNLRIFGLNSEDALFWVKFHAIVSTYPKGFR